MYTQLNSQSFLYQKPPTARIKSVRISVLSDQDMEQQSKVFVRSSSVVSGEVSGLLDSHLGTMSDTQRCLTCNQTRKLCVGHSGTIRLKYHYIIPQFEPYVQQLLKRICLTCSVLTGDSKKCNQCKQLAPTIKSTKGYKYQLNHNGKAISLTPIQIKEIFSKLDLSTITNDLKIGVFPTELIAQYIYVSPPIIRPDKRIQSQFKNSDDFTVSLQGIAKQAFKLNEMNDNDPQFPDLYESFVQVLQNYHKGDKTGDDDAASNKMKSLATSIGGKEGRIRKDLLGKRVNKIARAVIACDVQNAPDVVTIPLEFAMTVHMREIVRPYNFERLHKLFKNGPNVYPGADYIVKSDGKRYQIGNANVKMEEGDTIFRHLQNGDPVLMNRQPSLLPMSIGTHKIKVAQTTGKDTLDINVLSCSQYHADFDGKLNSF